MDGESMLPVDMLSAAQTDAVLSGRPVTAAAESLHELQVLVAALRAPAQPDELVAQAQTVQAFCAERQRLLSPRAQGRRPRRAGKVVAITSAVVVAFGGAAAAAVTTGVLPGAPWQHQPPSARSTGSTGGAGLSGTAHPGSSGGAIGRNGSASPAASPTGADAHTTGQGPDATGVAAYGLCHAYAANPGGTSVAMRNLAAAAEAAGKTVPQYCAVVLAQPPGHSSHTASSSGHPSKPPHPTRPVAPGPTKASKPTSKPSKTP